MLSRNSFLFKGFIRQSIWKPLSPFGKRAILNENVLQLIKNGNIISNQKNITDINLMMKGKLRCTSKLSNILSPNSVIDKNDEKIDEKEEEAVVEKNQNVSDIIESIPIKRNCDILPESYIPATSKLSTEQRSPRTSTSSKKTLRYPDFEIVNHPTKNGDPTKTLIIHDSKNCSDEKIWCHTFHFNKKKDKFICNKRQKGVKVVSAKLPIKDGEEIIELSNYEFVGEPVLYKEVMEKLNRLQNLEYEIIEKPYFKIKENGSSKNKPLLTVFTNKDRTYGRELYYNASNDIFRCPDCYSEFKTHVSAKLYERKNGSVFLKMGKHVCEPIDVRKIIVKENDYVKLKNGQIFIFSSKETNMGRKYFWDNFKNSFVCSECFPNLTVTAKPFPDANNKEHLKLSKTEHICKPIQYQCDISEIEQPDLEWPKTNEGIAECENLITIIQENHPIGKYPLYAWTYVITSAPPESTPERKASCILYVGYSENCDQRSLCHVRKDGIISKLLKKYDQLYMIPFYSAIHSACYDLEALIYELWLCGSLQIQLRNIKRGEWKSNGEGGSLKFIAENPDNPRHAQIVLGTKKLLITQIAKVQSSEIKVLILKKSAKSSL